jgi:DNA-binding MarR family transcriptional regulator
MDRHKDRPTLDDIARSCIALRLRLLNRVVTDLYDDALRPLDLKISQLNLLVVTAKLGLAQPATVCDLLQLDTSTLSRNVERMRAKGWLEAVPGEDGRTQPFRLTARGRKLLERASPACGNRPSAGRRKSWATTGSPCSTKRPASWGSCGRSRSAAFFFA